MGLNTGRTCIGASDYSTKAYSFDDDGRDPDLKHFSIDHDKDYILPMLREARKVNPDLFLFSSPWSPPGWMKATTQCWTAPCGGSTWPPMDEVGRPNIGPFSCGGPVTIDSKTEQVTRSGQYIAFAHYCRMIRRGARRFDSQSTEKDLHHVAVQNLDGQRVLVATNLGSARKVALRMGKKTAELALDTNSIVTLAWS